MRPLTVSIVTPAYNQGQFLSQTIESVLSQEGNVYIEYIILDDGSTDETKSVIEKYDNILKDGVWSIKCLGISYRWDSGQNQGQVRRLNQGLRMATGDIVAWLSSDDYFDQTVASRVAQAFLADPELLLAYGDSVMIDESGKPRKDQPPPARNDETFESLRTRGNSFTMNFFRTSVLKEVGYLDESLHYCMDLDLWMRIFRAGRAQYVPGFFGWYRLWPGSKTVSKQRLFSKERKIIAKRYGGNRIPSRAIYRLRGNWTFLNVLQWASPRLYGALKRAFYAIVDLYKY